MTAKSNTGRRAFAMAGLGFFLLVGAAILFTCSKDAQAGPWRNWRDKCSDSRSDGDSSDVGGSWYWMRSPDEEKRVVMGLYNRYCIRCHGVDGRGIWDIPGVPDFTNARWQATRSDRDLARVVIEGRGAVMPPFRGAMTLEESWAMARYLRTFVPGTEIHRPDLNPPEKKAPAKVDSPKDKKMP